MNDFFIEIQRPNDTIRPYIKIWFNGQIDQDCVSTWLNSLDSIDHVNMNCTPNGKYEAIVHLSRCWDIDEAKLNIEGALARFFDSSR